VTVTEEMQAAVNGVVATISEELARLAPALPYMAGGAEAGRLRRTLLNSREHFLCALSPVTWLMSARCSRASVASLALGGVFSPGWRTAVVE
jgi:hypothetical protein